MATIQGSGVPRVKVEGPPDDYIKQELEDVDMPSPYVDEDDDDYEEAGDLDFAQSQLQLWLSHVPRALWEKWSSMGQNEDVEIGTLRIEGPEDNPQRVGKCCHPIRVYN